MKKTRLGKILRYYVRRIAYNFKLLRVLKSISREKYDEKISASLVYGFLSAIAVNFFFQPGRVYSSGATGLAQIVYHSCFLVILCQQSTLNDHRLLSNWP